MKTEMELVIGKTYVNMSGYKVTLVETNDTHVLLRYEDNSEQSMRITSFQVLFKEYVEQVDNTQAFIEEFKQLLAKYSSALDKSECNCGCNVEYYISGTGVWISISELEAKS